MKTYAQIEWNRALRTLETARLILDSDPDSSASRAYYAAFHALSALFSLKGRSFNKHSALRAAVHQDLVHSREWPPSLGKDFQYLSSLRDTGDYGGVDNVSSENAKAAAECAQRIIERVCADHPELNPDE